MTSFEFIQSGGRPAKKTKGSCKRLERTDDKSEARKKEKDQAIQRKAGKDYDNEKRELSGQWKQSSSQWCSATSKHSRDRASVAGISCQKSCVVRAANRWQSARQALVTAAELCSLKCNWLSMPMDATAEISSSWDPPSDGISWVSWVDPDADWEKLGNGIGNQGKQKRERPKELKSR